jgi:dihydrofolate reductase
MSRKILLQVAVSLDGLIEGPNGEFDWCFTDQDYGMTAFLQGIDTIMFGRKSYEMMVRHAQGEMPWPDKRHIVFSQNNSLSFTNAEVVSDDVINYITNLKATDGLDIWLFGGASLFNSLLNAGLVDEVILAVHPIILGSGKLLFQDIGKRQLLRLKSHQAYNSGLVMLGYEVS